MSSDVKPAEAIYQHQQAVTTTRERKTNIPMLASSSLGGGVRTKVASRAKYDYLSGTIKDYGGLDIYASATNEVTTCPASYYLRTGLPGAGHYSVNKYNCAGSTAQSSAAAAFFARAAQKLNLSTPQWRKRDSFTEDAGVGFSGVLHRSPPPVPPALLRRIGIREVNGVGKVKVMLRVCGIPEEVPDPPVKSVPAGANGPNSSSFFSVDVRRKQVTLFDPAVCGGSSAPEDRRVGVAAPKMFAFDALFTQQDTQGEVCSSALTDVIHAVINGNDGCLFCYGHARLGKTQTMVGTPDSLGVIPCAISWLFRGITEQKQKTGARFSVRVSAVEVVTQPSPHVRDLLLVHANDCEQSPGVFLRDDPLFGTHLQNQVELRVPTADKAAFYLDAALASRSVDEGHMLYTLHVYQYSVGGKGGVAGGRSRLHLIDLASCEKGKANGGIPLSGIGNVLLAIFNGQKHLPYREHKLTQLLKECLSSLTCHAAMIAHVSPYVQHYTDTLATIQLASRIHRMRRRKIKFGGGSNGSGGSSGEEASRFTGSSDVDPSSSEQSADTVIYVGPSDDATDGEHPPVYIPSMNSGDNRCAMGKALRGSGAEHRPRHKLANTTKTSSNGSSLEGSPTHRSAKSANSIGKPPISNCKSPVRSLKSNGKVISVKEQDLQGMSANKLPLANGAVSTSDEQWIDGPRISKSKVAEARSLLKKKETWIDGPMQAANSPSLIVSNGHGNNHISGVSGGTAYGFMDNHKKTMIRKWVENQSVQSPRITNPKYLTSQRPPTTGGPASQQPYKEMTVFKTFKEDDKVDEDEDVTPVDITHRQEIADGEVDLGEVLVVDNGDEEEEEDGVGDIPPALQLFHPQHKNGSDDCDDSYSNIICDTHVCNTELEGEDIIDCDEEEEVEEINEPVPMQDSCLQVTEEDIAFCMGEMENPLPEVDQENIEEHPLRILSQENLTVVSTFADTISVSSEGRHRYSLYEQEDRFQQLARLHEMYRTKLAKSSVTSFRQPPSRCQSLSLTDMLYDGGCNDTCNASIYSVPAFTYGDKICDNCKMSLGSQVGNDRWYKPTSCNISSLRHPDGASNPNLKEEVERIPGNGASVSDHEEETAKRSKRGSRAQAETKTYLSSCHDDVRTVTGKAEDDDEDILMIPPPLSVPTPSRAHTRFLNKTSSHQESSIKSPTTAGYQQSIPTYKSLSSMNQTKRAQQRGETSYLQRGFKDVSCSPIHNRHNHSSKTTEGSKESSLRDYSSLPASKEPSLMPVPVLQYCREDVERLERRWIEVHGGRIKELQSEQLSLKAELVAAKTRLLIPADRWSFERNSRGSSLYEHQRSQLHGGSRDRNTDPSETCGGLQVTHSNGHML